MKKVLSVFLAAVMLLGTFSIGVVAASDTCIKLTDTSGASGYSAGSDAVNAWVVENEGGTLIFDVKLESVATPGSGKVSRLVAFTGDEPYNYAGYDFTNSQFIAGAGTNWPTANQTTTYTAYSTNKYAWKTGVWYEIAFQFNANEATVYLDGIPMVSAEIDSSFVTDYLILYPQYCTVLIDNLRVCGKDYNVRDRYGDVYAATDFTGVTSVGAVSCWSFSTDGYSVSTGGRPMPELGDMLPERTVSPAIDGAYLKYSEAGGVGTGTSVINFTAYKGFTYVEDVRIDRKSAAATFGVRFGDYIAGYDWDNGCFRIAMKSGYGFNTTDTYTYAKTEYALTMKTVYEFAVRLDGNIVSVYLDGVLMARAVNDAFAQNYSNVEVSHYRLGASIDNVVVAYPDYDVREAKGSAAAKFTFDEDISYIDGIFDYNLDNGNTGYTIARATDAAAVSVANVEASEGKATVGITLANCTDFNAFELEIAYPDGFTVAQVATLSVLNGTSAISPTNNNPVVVSYVAPANGTVADGKIMNVVFNTPSAAGSYNITVKLTPYINDVPGASFSGTGTVTVPEAGIPVGLPSGFAYDGENFTWNEVDGAAGYEIYMMYEGDDYEYYIDFTDVCEYNFPADDWIPDAGNYTFKVYVYNEYAEISSVSNSLIVIREEDGSVFGGLPAYSQELYKRLAALAVGPYSNADQQTIDTLLTEARNNLAASSDPASMVAVYDEYAAKISEVPIKKELTAGTPAGLAYDGETLSWNAAAGATAYDIYMLYEGDDYEYYVDQTAASEYALSAVDNFSDAGLYTFRVYMYDTSSEITGVSDDLEVVIEADGTVVAGGLEAYAEVLISRLNESVAGNSYTDENQAQIDSLLAGAANDIAAAVYYATMVETYESYEALIAEVPVTPDGIKGDVNDDGSLTTADYGLLVRIVSGVNLSYSGVADINGDGSVNNLDVAALKALLSK